MSLLDGGEAGCAWMVEFVEDLLFDMKYLVLASENGVKLVSTVKVLVFHFRHRITV